MADITLNSAVRSNLRTMQQTTELMNRTEERLATGKKVNSALDNPSNFFTAQSLERRAGDLGALLDSVATSVKTLEAADNGISAINKLLDQMKSTARSAQQSPSAVGTRAAFESGVIAGATADNTLGGTAQVGTAASADFVAASADYVPASADYQAASADYVAASATTLDGASGTFGTYTGGDITIDGETITIADDADVDAVRTAISDALGAGYTVGTDSGQLTISKADGTDIAVSGDDTLLTAIGFATGNRAATNGTEQVGTAQIGTAQVGTAQVGTAASADYQAAVPGISGTLTVSVGGASATTITFGTADGEVSTLEELNAALRGAGARATLSSDGELKIETLNQNDADSLTIGGSLVSTDGTPATGEIFDFATPAAATAEAVIDDSQRRLEYKRDYNDLLGQINELAKDASFNGVNLLAGDNLKVTFNESGESFLDIEGVNILEKLNLSALSDEDLMDTASAEAVIEALNVALDNLSSQASKFGSQLSVVQTRESFTKDMIGTLEDGAYSLTGADTNVEAANLATLQTRQQLIVSALSISTSQEQNILQLLQ